MYESPKANAIVAVRFLLMMVAFLLVVVTIPILLLLLLVESWSLLKFV